MKLPSLALALVVTAVLSTSAKAQVLYNFTFTGDDGMDATGTISVLNGVAVGGTINVTGVQVEASPLTLISAAGSLIPGSGVAHDPNGDDLNYDNVVNFANTPILDGSGVSFGSGLGQYAPNLNDYTTLIGLNGGDLYGNIPPTGYTLFVGQAVPDNNEYVYTSTYGSLEVVPAVPEPSSWALGLIGIGALAFLRHRHRNA